MDDLDRALLAAFDAIVPKLRGDPAELRRRLARRRTPALTRPPRAWCLAVRASDTRLTAWNTAMVPEDAADTARDRRGRMRVVDPQPHTLTLEKHVLLRLCRPVRFEPMGYDWQHAAAMLGVHEETLRYAIRKGVFHVKHRPRSGGKRGKPVPILTAARVFDPSSSSLMRPPDPLWGTLWHHLAARLPDDLEEEVQRVPSFRLDPRDVAKCRTVPIARFRGWRFVCPMCGQPVRAVFYPLPVPDLPTMLGLDPETLENKPLAVSGQRFAGDDDDAEIDLLPPGFHIEHTTSHIDPPTRSFACHACHRVRYFSRLDRNSWNHLIAHLSAGLLYGREVEQPDWFTDPTHPDNRPRKRPYKQRPRPTPRRDAVRRRLLAGMTYKQIADALNLTTHGVDAHVKAIYREARMHSREELRAVCGSGERAVAEDGARSWPGNTNADTSVRG